MDKNSKNAVMINDNHDELAYMNVSILNISLIFTSLSILFIFVGVFIGYHLEYGRLHSSVTIWYDYNRPSEWYITKWGLDNCNVTFINISYGKFPSLLRLFQLNPVTSGFFRGAVLISIALHLFQGFMTSYHHLVLDFHPIYKIFDIIAPLFLIIERFSLGIIATNSIFRDSFELNYIAYHLFIINVLFHMLSRSISSLFFCFYAKKILDYLSFMLKVSGLIGFAFAVPQIYSYHLEFIFAPICHFYVQSSKAISEILLIFSYFIFHISSIIDIRDMRLLCHPLASSGECEPLKPENFQKGGKFEFCR